MSYGFRARLDLNTDMSLGEAAEEERSLACGVSGCFGDGQQALLCLLCCLLEAVSAVGADCGTGKQSPMTSIAEDHTAYGGPSDWFQLRFDALTVHFGACEHRLD